MTESLSNYISTDEIKNISLTREDYEYINKLMENYLSVKNDYKIKKNSLLAIENEAENDKSNRFWHLLNKKKPEFDYNQLKKEVRQLKEQKDGFFYKIRDKVNVLISNNDTYKEIYNKTESFKSINDEILQKNELYFTLVSKKKRIDDFFNNLTYHLENNLAISPEKNELYMAKYKDYIKLLEDVYNYQHPETRNNDLIMFNSKLNLDDPYTILALINTLQTKIINPTFNTYKNDYKEFQLRLQYINAYNKRINEITNKILKYA